MHIGLEVVILKCEKVFYFQLNQTLDYFGLKFLAVT